jgi:hypothetical protein
MDLIYLQGKITIGFKMMILKISLANFSKIKEKVSIAI